MRQTFNVIPNRDEMQADLDIWLKEYNEQRLQTGKYSFGKNADADVYRFDTVDKGENGEQYLTDTATDGKTSLSD